MLVQNMDSGDGRIGSQSLEEACPARFGVAPAEGAPEGEAVAAAGQVLGTDAGKLTAVFQPHLYTRTRDFADEFAESLSKVDKVILLDIYPAREEPIPGITSEIIFEKIDSAEKTLLYKEELMDYLQNEPIDILITFGAGNIDRFIGPITEMLKKRTDE